MEGSESEAIFESLKLHPQLFINEVLNVTDDLVDGAFDFFHQEASKQLKTQATDRSDDLQKGIAYIRHMVQSVLDKRLGLWEKYSLRHCFTLPDGFFLPSGNDPSGYDPMDQYIPSDPQLDAQLDSLRNKLAEVGKECSELNRELRVMQKQSALSSLYTACVNEAVWLYEQSSTDDMLQEMMKTAMELRSKLENLKNKKGGNGYNNREQLCNTNGNLSTLSSTLSNVHLDDLREFIAEMNKM